MPLFFNMTHYYTVLKKSPDRTHVTVVLSLMVVCGTGASSWASFVRHGDSTNKEGAGDVKMPSVPLWVSMLTLYNPIVGKRKLQLGQTNVQWSMPIKYTIEPPPAQVQQRPAKTPSRCLWAPMKRRHIVVSKGLFSFLDLQIYILEKLFEQGVHVQFFSVSRMKTDILYHFCDNQHFLRVFKTI